MSQAVAQAGSAVERRTHYRWVVLVLIFLIYTIASADRANIGIAIPFIKAEFGLSNTEVGAIVSLFSLTYGIFQIPSAFLVQRLGVRTVMPLFMILTSILTATLGTATSALALQINRLALGVAEAPLANSLITTINNWFAPQEKGQAAGIFISAAKFGPVLVPPLGAVVILHFGWQYVFYFCAVPGIILPILWFLLVRANTHVSTLNIGPILSSGSSDRWMWRCSAIPVRALTGWRTANSPSAFFAARMKYARPTRRDCRSTPLVP